MRMNEIIDTQRSEASSAQDECERLKFLVYRDVFGGWRWEFRLADGHFVDSKQSYDSQADCVAAATRSASTRMLLKLAADTAER
jgi:uncharacterized protein YegP (UPF0339 family)